MGNYKFKISNILPNSWFHKPIYHTTTSKKAKKQPIKTSSLSLSSSSSSSLSSATTQQRKSYYFTRDLTLHKQDPTSPKTRLPDPPRKSSKKRRPATNNKPVHQITPEPVWTRSNPDSTSSGSGSSHESITCSCKTSSSSDDICRKVELRPIITKPEKHGSGKWIIEEVNKALSVKVVKEGITRSSVRRLSAGGKVKANCYSPRVGSRVRVQAINGGRRSTGNRRSLSESMAVMKTSVDPQRDFKESMVEMIMENNMKSSKELEDLLACYLSLNSDEYHELIIKVFKQIWFESSILDCK